MKDNPKYQWSVFTANRNEQYVVRCDDFAEFEQGIRNIRHKMQEEAPDKEFEPQEMPKICDIHNVPMMKKKGPYGEFWSHRWAQSFCNGKQ